MSPDPTGGDIIDMCTQQRLRLAWAFAVRMQMPRLIRVFVGCTGHFVCFVVLWLICTVPISKDRTVKIVNIGTAETIAVITVVPCCNNYLYNGNFNFRRNFFGNGSFLMKIYYIITEFALSNTDGDSRQRNAFLTLFIKTTEKKIQYIVYLQKFSTCHKPLRSLLQMIDRQIKGD